MLLQRHRRHADGRYHRRPGDRLRGRSGLIRCIVRCGFVMADDDQHNRHRQLFQERRQPADKWREFWSHNRWRLVQFKERRAPAVKSEAGAASSDAPPTRTHD
jgi:hypothetical protein